MKEVSQECQVDPVSNVVHSDQIKHVLCTGKVYKFIYQHIYKSMMITKLHQDLLANLINYYTYSPNPHFEDQSMRCNHCKVIPRILSCIKKVKIKFSCCFYHPFF